MAIAEAIQAIEQVASFEGATKTRDVAEDPTTYQQASITITVGSPTINGFGELVERVLVVFARPKTTSYVPEATVLAVYNAGLALMQACIDQEFGEMQVWWEEGPAMEMSPEQPSATVSIPLVATYPRA